MVTLHRVADLQEEQRELNELKTLGDTVAIIMNNKSELSIASPEFDLRLNHLEAGDRESTDDAWWFKAVSYCSK